MEITTLMLLFILIWGIIGIAFFCIGIGLHARGQRKRSICTRPVTAIVVDLQRERVGVDDFSVSGEAVMKSWFPVYEYMIDGVKQKSESACWNSETRSKCRAGGGAFCQS